MAREVRRRHMAIAARQRGPAWRAPPTPLVKVIARDPRRDRRVCVFCLHRQSGFAPSLFANNDNNNNNKSARGLCLCNRSPVGWGRGDMDMSHTMHRQGIGEFGCGSSF